VYRLHKQFAFEAAHFLPRHDGKCKALHGHSWVGWLCVEAPALQTAGPKTGMAADYADIARVGKLVEARFDHACLNEFFPHPTSEVVAAAVWEMAEPLVAAAGGGVRLSSVRIEETCTSACDFFGPPRVVRDDPEAGLAAFRAGPGAGHDWYVRAGLAGASPADLATAASEQDAYLRGALAAGHFAAAADYAERLGAIGAAPAASLRRPAPELGRE
jgi:6-pyruvoyltetrahydropterin/6-carboxytetrahydropterin synthase